MHIVKLISQRTGTAMYLGNRDKGQEIVNRRSEAHRWATLEDAQDAFDAMVALHIEVVGRCRWDAEYEFAGSTESDQIPLPIHDSDTEPTIERPWAGLPPICRRTLTPIP
jgi:hypothetical protein